MLESAARLSLQNGRVPLRKKGRDALIFRHQHENWLLRTKRLVLPYIPLKGREAWDRPTVSSRAEREYELFMPLTSIVLFEIQGGGTKGLQLGR